MSLEELHCLVEICVFIDSAEMVTYLLLIAEIPIRSQGKTSKIFGTGIDLGNRHFAKNIHL
jgi:hypothetical protein